MELILCIVVGIALSAACGFRVFVPLLVVSMASVAGHLELSDGMAWIGTPAAFTVFAVATLLEVAAYYVPVVDHALDTVATPAAVVAGIVVSASVFTEVSPLLRWALAIIAGGGAAGVVQTATVSARGVSTMSSAGILNPVFSTLEAAGSLLTSTIAIWLPLMALVVLIGALATVFAIRLRRQASLQPV